jgi:two-component system sensor histidine kinase KdpD
MPLIYARRYHGVAMNLHKRLFGVSLLLIAVSTVVYFNQSELGITGAVMCYLLVVLAGAYYLRLSLALGLALLASLLINFLIVEPRYSFHIARLESWVALAGFLGVSLVVTSLVRRLQERTEEAEAARTEAQFARMLAERLAQQTEPESLLATAVDILQPYLQKALCIAYMTEDGMRTVPAAPAFDVDAAAVIWAMQNARPLGPGTDNWPESVSTIMPFSRLPGNEPVLVIAREQAQAVTSLTLLRSLCDQLALAYGRAVSTQRAQQAELKARTEAMQNALLTSLSHDMRTPLTAIMGAASTLDSQQRELDEAGRQQLLTAIRSEADYLCRATENILSLARLDALGDQGMRLDWQSPEEIIGSTLARYRARGLSCELQTSIKSDVLVRVDAILLSQALANLLDNALSVHQGSEPLLVSARQDGNRLIIAIADRGPGFPAGFNVAALERFSSRHGRGFGIGLVIVSTIASLHGAELGFEPRPGGGTEVRLSFPIQVQAPIHD